MENGKNNLIQRRAFDLLLAAAFLTRLPVPFNRQLQQRPLADIAWAFPLVGLVVGAAGAAVLLAGFYLGLHPLLGGLLAVGVQVLLTGALHEDGLADVADGFGGGDDKADKLRIMRDSRLGSYGVLALVFSVAIRAAALASITTPVAAALALIAAGAVSRGMVVGVMRRMDMARSDGVAAGGGRPSGPATLVALGLAAVAALLLLGAAGLIVVAAAAVAAWALAGLSKRQIGGVSGDVLGAVQQVAEAAVLIGAVAAARI